MSNLKSLPTPSKARHLIGEYTAQERVEMRETRDWLETQEEAEVDALIMHMFHQSGRSMKLEAYD